VPGGMPRSWCRDPKNQFAFEPADDICWASYRLALYRNSNGWKDKHDDTKQATQLSVRFRKGHEPDVGAGLDLEASGVSGA
jgi:hypothetical protein